MGFWAAHGWIGGVLFALCLLVIPRITLFLGAVVFGAFASGGFFLWWVLGWLCFPRILIALIAISTYGPTNPMLCLIATLMLVGLECGEKAGGKKILV